MSGVVTAMRWSETRLRGLSGKRIDVDGERIATAPPRGSQTRSSVNALTVHLSTMLANTVADRTAFGFVVPISTPELSKQLTQFPRDVGAHRRVGLRPHRTAPCGRPGTSAHFSTSASPPRFAPASTPMQKSTTPAAISAPAYAAITDAVAAMVTAIDG